MIDSNRIRVFIAQKNLQIVHIGWIPKGRRIEAGTLPGKYKLKEISSSGYPKRTEQNVIDSDGTLIISHGKLTGGSSLTVKLAKQHKKEWLHIDLKINRGYSIAQLVKSWIFLNDIKVLSLDGPRESEDPVKKGELMKDCRFMAKGKIIDEDAAAELIIKSCGRSCEKLMP